MERRVDWCKSGSAMGAKAIWDESTEFQKHDFKRDANGKIDVDVR